MPASSVILPYAVLEKSRKKKFDTNMELAAILSLAEARRKKHAMVGFSTEKILFVSKLHYPLWIVPWESTCLIVDGLQIFLSNLTYMELPDIELFLNDIERGQTIREEFSKALDKHSQTLTGFSEAINIPMEAVVTDKALLSSIAVYVEEAQALNATITGNVVLIPPKITHDAAEERAKQVSDLYERLQSDVKELEHAALVVDEAMQLHDQRILREMELVSEAFKDEIDSVKPEMEKKVELLLKERDAKIERMNKAFEAELNKKIREKESRQKRLEKLELQRTEYKKRLELRRNRHDRIGVARWEHSVRTCENKISEVKEGIQGISHSIEKVRKQNQEDIDKLKYGYQTLIDRERNKIVEIEASLESVTKAKKGESEKLQLMTRRIVSQLGQLAENKRLHMADLQGLTIPWKLEQVTLLAVPFFLIGYKAERKLRYSLYPPFKVMSSEGIVKKIEKTILSFRLGSRIKLLLQSRSKALEKMFSIFLEEKIKSDKTFGESLRELGMWSNVLEKADFKEVLTKGLKELQAEGWIKQEEGVLLLKQYA